MAEAQAKNISTQERVAQVEDIYVKVEMLQRSIAGVPAYVDLVDNRVAGVEAALGMLSIASQELEVAAMDGKEAQARLRAKYTGHEARIQDLVHSHKEHQEHAVRIEAQLQGQTLDLEKKIALLEGQFQLCRAEIAHSAQIEAILNTRAAPDLLTATLLSKIEVMEKTTQRSQWEMATVVGNLSATLHNRFNEEAKNVQKIDMATRTLHQEVKDLKTENARMRSENSRILSENAQLQTESAQLQYRMKNLEGQQNGLRAEMLEIIEQSLKKNVRVVEIPLQMPPSA